MVEAGSSVGRAPLRHGAPPLRLTRRGRLVLASLLLALAAAVSSLAASPGQAASPARSAPTVVVGRDDTLWSIAHRYAPDRDVFETIDEIRQLNGIADYTVHPGQRLSLPRRR